MKLIKGFLLIISPLIIMNSCATHDKADLIIINARIYTVDSAGTVAQAMAVKDGRILATGSTGEIVGKYSSVNMVDLKGKPVFPGFYDSHCHFFKYGTVVKLMANLRGSKSMEEVIGIAREHHAKFGGEWVAGRGWDQNDWVVKAFPDRSLLDEAFPDNPVVLIRVDGHAVVANSKAIGLSGITEKNIAARSEALYDAAGRFTGVFLEGTADKFKALVPPASAAQLPVLLGEAESECFSYGLTSVGDAGLETPAIKLIDSLHRNGLLKIRVYAMLDPSGENLRTFVQNGPYKTDRLHVCSIKLYADGALGSRGACLLEPYADDPANRGIMVTTADTFRMICRQAYDHGYQVNTHCIGDSANRFVLNIYGECLKGGNDRRWRIEHAQVIKEDDFGLFKQYSVIPSVQPTHATSDMHWAGERLGPVRVKGAYAYKRLLQQNGWINSGTDFPIEEINPLYTFYAAVARQDLKHQPPGGFQPEDALSRKEALRSMTIWAAKACFEEKEKGSLEAGKWADFVVLGQDIMLIPLDEVPEVRVLNTYLAGIEVYNGK